MVDASYNSTTSITTFEVTAFDGKDAAAIAQAVLKASDELVNELSTKARLQLDLKRAERSDADGGPSGRGASGSGGVP